MMPSLDRITFFQRNEANSNPSTLDVARSKDKTLMATEISRKEDETVMPELQSSHSENETPIRPNPAEIRQDQAQDTEKPSSSTLGKERGIRRIGMKLNSLFNNKGSVHYPKILKGHRSWVMAVAFSPDGELVASGSEDGSLKLWNPTKGRCCQTLKGHYIPGPKPASFISTGIQAVAFSPGGKLVASAARDRAIELWDLAACEDRGRLLGHTDMVCAIAFSPDGKLIASGSVDRTARLWDLATCEDRWTLECKGSVLDVAFSPDGKLVASASKYGTVHLWDSATGQQSGIYKGYGCWVLSAAFSPDGKLVASALKDGSISLWNPATSVGRGTLVGHTGFVSAVAFSPDGKLLASASEDGTVRLWDPATRKSYGILKGHSGVVFAVAFSPDSTLIASASEDRTVRLWDLPTGQTEEELAPPPLPSPLSPIPP
jgi:WD40 repeat protein